MTQPKIRFLGAAGTVTGSRFLVETGAARVLVDCGLFQGRKEVRKRNWAPFTVSPSDIDAVVLTHAHIDHTGYLPALCRDGFEGAIHCTLTTADLTEMLLEDSARIQQEDARYANRKKFTKHKPARAVHGGGRQRGCGAAADGSLQPLVPRRPWVRGSLPARGAHHRLRNGGDARER